MAATDVNVDPVVSASDETQKSYNEEQSPSSAEETKSRPHRENVKRDQGKDRTADEPAEEIKATTDGDQITLVLRTKTIVLDIKHNDKGHCLYLAEERKRSDANARIPITLDAATKIHEMMLFMTELNAAKSKESTEKASKPVDGAGDGDDKPEDDKEKAESQRDGDRRPGRAYRNRRFATRSVKRRTAFSTKHKFVVELNENERGRFVKFAAHTKPIFRRYFTMVVPDVALELFTSSLQQLIDNFKSKDYTDNDDQSSVEAELLVIHEHLPKDTDVDVHDDLKTKQDRQMDGHYSTTTVVLNNDVTGPQLPPSTYFGGQFKRFYFDFYDNGRGVNLRLSEVTPTMRSYVTIPRRNWLHLRDTMIEICGGVHKGTNAAVRHQHPLDAEKKPRTEGRSSGGRLGRHGRRRFWRHSQSKGGERKQRGSESEGHSDNEDVEADGEEKDKTVKPVSRSMIRKSFASGPKLQKRDADEECVDEVAAEAEPDVVQLGEQVTLKLDLGTEAVPKIVVEHGKGDC